ncbi:MAG TPA: diguanylate cyclase [Aurantimonas coralicida]|uniref:Diguanylate cyclase n=2 Tax=root TaxID=1 RepID=A0A9C9NC31_9HYPH|nr:diguanylate cyclase [Aurantimonas coralicida]HET99284.1 diguanylate cyclase [Aurantimonas coralicida]
MESARSIQLAVLDDDPIFLEYISAMLGHDGDMEITQASDGSQLLRALKADPIDCVLVDYNLGAENGLNIAETIRATIPNAPPIVMLTGGGSERTAVKAFRSGFSDYVSKRDLNKHELVTAIRSAVGTRKKAQSETIEADLIKKRLQFDNVTGLYSAQFMQERLGQFTGRGASSAFGIVLIKLRNLAQIRASLGHIAGDRLLHNFAKRLNLATHASDLCGSLDDDSFLYLIDRDVDARAISQCCRRLAQELTLEVNLDRSVVQIIPAIGAAMSPADGTDPTALIQAAQQALDTAAASGKPFGTAFDEAAPSLEASSQPDASPSLERDRAEPSLINERDERRAERRQRVFKRGTMYLRQGDAVIDCTVRNLSASGALLRVDIYFAAPDRFDLVVVGSGSKRAVETKWQSGNDIGVQFLEGSE